MEQLFTAIPEILKHLEPNSSATNALVFAVWKRVAGELLRSRTEPLEYKENRLVVAVEDKTWQTHLEQLSPQMIAKLNATLGQGSVKFIEFRVDPTRNTEPETRN